MCWFANWWLIKATMNFIFISFALLHSMPKTMGLCSPICSTLAVPPIIHPIYCGRQLLVGCCMFLLNSSRLRPRPQPSLYFSIGLVLASQSMKPAMARAHRMPRACYRLIGSSGAKIWSIAGVVIEREGQSHWRVGGWWLMLVVVSCGCIFVLWLAVEHFILPIL